MRPIFIFIYFLYFFICSSGASFAEEPLGLSGKYKDYNVILIILDAMRYDHLSCYGYTKETSPNIDKLAKQGVIFTNAFSQSHNTLSSVVSIFTSLYPSSHAEEYIYKDKFPDNTYTLSEILNIYGYRTIWFGSKSDPHSGRANGLLTGFDEQFDLWPTLNGGLKEYDKVFSAIKKYQKAPFFITIHSYLTHETVFPLNRFDNRYNAPKKFIDKLENLLVKKWEYMRYACEHNPKELDKIFGKGWSKKNSEYFTPPYSHGNFIKIISRQDSVANEYKLFLFLWSKQIALFLDSLDNKDMPSLLSLLDSSVYEFDKDFISRLSQELKEMGLYDKTVIIITADHGNEYLEHGHIGHRAFLYDEVIQVPLIFHLPDLNKTLRVDSLVQSIDILPTILDLLGIPPPHKAQGISLTGLIEDNPKTCFNEYVFVKALNGSFVIRSKQWKLIRQKMGGDADQLYNIQKDPLEKNNLINIEPGIAKMLKAKLEAKISSLPVYSNKNSKFIPEIDSEARERIKKTGYW